MADGRAASGFSRLRRLARGAGWIGGGGWGLGVRDDLEPRGVTDVSVDSDAGIHADPHETGHEIADQALTAIGAAAPGYAGASLPRLAPTTPVPGESCELCGEAIQLEHRHLYELERRSLLCVCRGCALLFDRREAGGGRYRLIPDRTLHLAGFELDDGLWDRLDVPVDLAFFRREGGGERVVVHYPGALGAAESRLDGALWAELEARNPVLRTLEPEVEALLVNRVGGAREYWLAPLDTCYALVGLIRKHWKGLGGGDEVWGEVARFCAELLPEWRRDE